MKTYLILDPFSRLIKIGQSNNPTRRFLAIRNANPYAELFFITEEFSESFLHEKFKHKRVLGEWFNLDKFEILEITKSYKFIPKRLHYTNTKNDIKRKIITEKHILSFNEKYNYYTDLIPNIKFNGIEGDKLKIKAYNTKTNRNLNMILKSNCFGFILNGRFYSCSKLKKIFNQSI